MGDGAPCFVSGRKWINRVLREWGQCASGFFVLGYYYRLGGQMCVNVVVFLWIGEWRIGSRY